MKKYNTTILFTVLMSIMLCAHSYSQSFQTFDKQYRYYYGSIGEDQFTYYQFYVPANQMGVFTLKTKSYGSDYDIYTYRTSSLSSIVEKSNSPGTETELITMPVLDYGRWVFIKIKNDGNYGEYYFYAHNVDIEAKLGEALILAIFEGIFSSGNEVDDRNLSRGLNVASSILKESSLEDASRSFIINELTNELREELGYGATAGFFVNFIVSIFDEVLKNVW